MCSSPALDILKKSSSARKHQTGLRVNEQGLRGTDLYSEFSRNYGTRERCHRRVEVFSVLDKDETLGTGGMQTRHGGYHYRSIADLTCAQLCRKFANCMFHRFLYCHVA